ncbi:hypothetical protein SISNIDRAFT_485656 [Sistotremastrum niveocremeum HHB9708]|uniref:Pre-rRNA-processing protein n=1 Tax=Sistotremastrum niveocremeum HHB9708 TaxID=1314777 RepID=A0A164UNP2_9AGAM|nr:hypothetical protein SISNIDRAFT_485656 [Sistotremastrum niveocremeum HHB9708]
MPKATKKKKEKAADFTKAKLKIGKGKKAASNSVDTSFKARSIAVPSQNSLTKNNDDTPTTKRNLSVADLLLHLKHHNATTRKDAILGLREILEAYPHLVPSELANILSVSVRLVVDEDASVRRTLIAFYAHLLPNVPSSLLVPHIPLLLLFTTSAQSHIFPEIRVDAVKLVDILLDIAPDAVCKGWESVVGPNSSALSGTEGHAGQRVLDGCLGLLSVGERKGQQVNADKMVPTSGISLASTSKLSVLTSLSTFLRHALQRPDTYGSSDSTDIPTWYFASSFSSQRDFRSFLRLVRPSNQSRKNTEADFIWQERIVAEEPAEDFCSFFSLAKATTINWSIADISVGQVENESLGESGPSGHPATELAYRLQPLLTSTLLDCAPVVFAPSHSSPPETELNLILNSARIVQALYSAVFENCVPGDVRLRQGSEELLSYIGYMSPYFPFGDNAFDRRDIKVELIFQELNVIYCELVSLLLLGDEESSKKDQKGNRKGKRAEDALDAHVTRAAEFVLQWLEVETVGTPSRMSLTGTAYMSLLPTLWSLLGSGRLESSSRISKTVSDSILRAVVKQSSKASASSAVKRVSIQFIAHILLLQTIQGRRKHEKENVNIWQEWILGLPRVLWELGSNNAALTETILLLILRLFQRRSVHLSGEVIDQLCARLVPYFTIQHPTRGSLPGPFWKLSASTGGEAKRLVLHVAKVLLLCASAEPKEALGHAIRTAQN